MSSKTKTTAMKDDGKPALVPKLRFPEFQTAEEWENRPLGACLDYQQPTPYLVSDTNYSSAFNTPVLTAGKTFILGYTSEQHGIFSEDLPVIIFDDFTTATQFVEFPFKAKSSAMKILQAKNGANIKFMYEILQTLSYEVGAHERHWISKFAPMLVPVPAPPEQHKIAECLSSVDDLIAAQARKLDALNTQKKGLMQQLFPREGETQPRLRFPEFQNAGEWCVEPLGQLFDTASGGTPDRAMKEYWNGLIPWITTSLVDFNIIHSAEEFISDDGLENSSAKLFPKDTVLIAMYGQGKTRGKVALLGIQAATNQACAAVFPRNGIDPVFTFLSLSGRYEEMRTLSNSGGQENLSQGLIRQLPFRYPHDIAEQRRVVGALSALNDLLVAEAEKLEALKNHKQGLMQQLFPSAQGVET
jgi:type I restriction enzyme, S subunit